MPLLINDLVYDGTDLSKLYQSYPPLRVSENCNRLSSSVARMMMQRVRAESVLVMQLQTYRMTKHDNSSLMCSPSHLEQETCDQFLAKPIRLISSPKFLFISQGEYCIVDKGDGRCFDLNDHTQHVTIDHVY